jgi:P-type Ca2+ transporter type 2C
VTFLGASIFNVVSGVPFVPLQTLWVNFTTQVFQAIGLGYGEPGAGLMQRRPRDPEEPILSRPTMLWLVTIGLIMGAATLATIAGAESAFGRPVALTMGVVSFSLACLVFSLSTRDEARTVFSLDTLADKTLVRCTGATLVTLLLTTVFGPLQSFLETVPLSATQWLICAGAPLLVLVASELRVLVLRRRTGVVAA